MLALPRAAAAENGKHGVGVNAIAPGPTYSDSRRKVYPEEFFRNRLSDAASSRPHR